MTVRPRLEMHVTLFCSSILLSLVNAIKVITISGAYDPPSPLSFATVTTKKVLPLPRQFTFCSSHTQERLDEVGPFTLLDDQGKHWFSIVLWPRGGNMEVYSVVGNKGATQLLATVHDPKMSFWYTICVGINHVNGNETIQAAVNGKLGPIVYIGEQLEKVKPQSLSGKLVV